MLEQITAAVQAEFSDLSDVAHLTRVTLRLCFAALLGALIGYEREQRESPAGLRTHMLVALGCALFIVVPQQAGMDADGLSRVMQGLLAGIGFLGAGAVLKFSDRGEIHGLTTAASIWATAGIGVSIGLGREGTAVLATLLVLFILRVLLRVEQRFLPPKQDEGPASVPGDGLSARRRSTPAPRARTHRHPSRGSRT